VCSHPSPHWFFKFVGHILAIAAIAVQLASVRSSSFSEVPTRRISQNLTIGPNIGKAAELSNGCSAGCERGEPPRPIEIGGAGGHTTRLPAPATSRRVSSPCPASHCQAAVQFALGRHLVRPAWTFLPFMRGGTDRQPLLLGTRHHRFAAPATFDHEQSRQAGSAPQPVQQRPYSGMAIALACVSIARDATSTPRTTRMVSIQEGVVAGGVPVRACGIGTTPPRIHDGIEPA